MEKDGEFWMILDVAHGDGRLKRVCWTGGLVGCRIKAGGFLIELESFARVGKETPTVMTRPSRVSLGILVALGPH